MIDTALKDLIKQALREVLEEQQQGPLVPLEKVATMLGCRDARTALRALATSGIPVAQIGQKRFVNRTSLEAIAKMRKAGRLAS
jgi:hypothetical protein